MGKNSPSGPPDIKEMMEWVSAVLSELNVGLLIYHLEDFDDPESLKLLYANHAASEYTGADLNELVGMNILEAFPGLKETDLPETYRQVALTKRSLELGAFEYGGDDHVQKGHYSVKAFPMPSDCVGVIFENITVRMQLQDLVKKEREKSKH